MTRIFTIAVMITTVVTTKILIGIQNS